MRAAPNQPADRFTNKSDKIWIKLVFSTKVFYNDAMKKKKFLTIKRVVEYIVENSVNLKNRYLGEDNSPIDWICIFSQRDSEYKSLIKVAGSLGKVIQNTETGPIYKLNESIETEAGNLFILKVRKPDKTRPQRGNGDFRVEDFDNLKKNNLSQKQFSLIKRADHEMVELKDPSFDVLVYFSNPPISKVLGMG